MQRRGREKYPQIENNLPATLAPFYTLQQEMFFILDYVVTNSIYRLLNDQQTPHII